MVRPPPFSRNPPAKVDVAVLPVRLMNVPAMPAPNVEVEVSCRYVPLPTERPTAVVEACVKKVEEAMTEVFLSHSGVVVD